MAYKPSRKFVTEDAIAIDYELRKIAQKMPTGGSGTITGVTAGEAISGGGTTGTVTVNFAPSELSSVTVASDDKVIIADTSDSDNPKTVTASSIAALAPQGDITEVVAGTALSGGGSSGSVTLNVADVAVAQLADAAVQTSSESFADNDTSLMTSAAIQDKILSYGYITGVTNISGNAGTATALATARAINGVDFDGTAPITVTAAAGTLTGTELKSTVVTSSLTSVGTLGSLTVSGAFTPATVTASTVTVAADDLVLITDTSDSANVKKVTAQSIADLGGGGGADFSSVASDIVPDADSTRDLGTSSKFWAKAYVDEVNIATTGPILTEGNSNSLRIDTGDGTVDIGPMNTGGVHIYTNTENFFFGTTPSGGSQGVDVVITDSALYPYADNDLELGLSTRNWKRVWAEDGSSSAPAFCFGSDTNTGIYLKASGQLAISTNGVEHYFATNGLYLASGDWFRTSGSAGWYNGTYGGGWYMVDSTYVTTYGNKGINVKGNIKLNSMATFTGSGYATARRQDSTGLFKEYVSSERFKADITDLPLSEAVKILDSRPILFRDIEEHKEDPNSPVYAGLSAESLQQVGYEYPLKYDIDEDGNQTNTPRGIHHEHLVAPIILILRDMQERITYLEENKCQCQS